MQKQNIKNRSLSVIFFSGATLAITALMMIAGGGTTIAQVPAVTVAAVDHEPACAAIHPAPRSARPAHYAPAAPSPLQRPNH